MELIFFITMGLLIIGFVYIVGSLKKELNAVSDEILMTAAQQQNEHEYELAHHKMKIHIARIYSQLKMNEIITKRS